MGPPPSPLFHLARPASDPSLPPRRFRSSEGSHITCQQTRSLVVSNAVHQSQSAAGLDYQQSIDGGEISWFEGSVPVN